MFTGCEEFMTECYDHSTGNAEEGGDMTTMVDQSRPILLDLELPERYKKAEIVGGAVVMSPLRLVHGDTVFHLQTQLVAQLPAEFRFGYDLIMPFPAEGHELCPDLTIFPTSQMQAEDAVCQPDWAHAVFEVISPSTKSIDYKVKVGAYASVGIPEYVIFDPYAHTATRYAKPEHGEFTLRHVIRYGGRIVLETPFPCVIETRDLPVVAKQ